MALRNGSVLYEKALTHLQGNQLSIAEKLAIKAINGQRNNPDYYFLAAEIAYQAGHFEKAVKRYHNAIQLDPNQADYHYSLANAYYALKRPAKAISSYLNVISLSPKDHESHNNLANCYDAVGRAAEAEDHYCRAIQLDPKNTAYQLNMADFLISKNRHQAGLELLKNIVSQNPKDHIALFKLAVCHQESGNFEEAEKLHHMVLNLQPATAISAFHLSCFARISEDDKLISKCSTQLERATNPKQKSYWHFALGNVYRKNKLFQQSFLHYAAGNDIKSREKLFRSNDHHKYVDGLIQFFDLAFFESEIYSKSEESPIFIVGMPRSGSTLIEQILSSHSEVSGIGEHNGMRDLVRALRNKKATGRTYPNCLKKYSAAEYDKLAEQYGQSLLTVAPIARRTCDKMLGNFLRLGLIAKIFPNARIIHAAREPMDCCWSSYTQLFENGMAFSYNLENLGLAYVQYQQLMHHWHQVLPLSIHTIQYEKLVHHPDQVAKQLFDFCDLKWHESYLDIKDNPRAVRTASFWQVRQPIYHSSVGGWRNYEQFIEPLKRALIPSAEITIG